MGRIGTLFSHFRNLNSKELPKEDVDELITIIETMEAKIAALEKEIENLIYLTNSVVRLEKRVADLEKVLTVQKMDNCDKKAFNFDEEICLKCGKPTFLHG